MKEFPSQKKYRVGSYICSILAILFIIGSIILMPMSFEKVKWLTFIFSISTMICSFLACYYGRNAPYSKLNTLITQGSCVLLIVGLTFLVISIINVIGLK